MKPYFSFLRASLLISVAIAGCLILAACGSHKVASSSTTSTTAATGAASSSTTAATGATTCKTSALALSVGTKTAATAGATQFSFPIYLKNTSTTPCQMTGFPGVAVTNSANAGGVSIYNVHRSNDVPKTITVAPNASAVATVTYIDDTAAISSCTNGLQWNPTQLQVIPPDQTQALTAKWSMGSFWPCQSAATHPGDFVTTLSLG